MSGDDMLNAAVATVAALWPTDSSYVNEWHAEDAALYRRSDWQSFAERSAAILRQRQQRIATAVLAPPLAELDEVRAENERLRASFEVVRERLTRDEWHPLDSINAALQHIEAVMAGQARPLALAEAENARLTRLVADLRKGPS